MRNISSPLDAAVLSLKQGGVILYPTDTLMGLGASATRRIAVSRLFRLKARPERMPVSILFSSTEEIEPFVRISPKTRAEVRRLLPGPFTVILEASEHARKVLAPGCISREGGLGVRVSDHLVARELARRAGPITTTSANLHGGPPVRSLAQARRIFRNAVSVYLEPLPSPAGVPSTLVDLRGPRPVVTVRDPLAPPKAPQGA